METSDLSCLNSVSDWTQKTEIQESKDRMEEEVEPTKKKRDCADESAGDARPFPCPTCGKAFKTKPHLQRHWKEKGHDEGKKLEEDGETFLSIHM